jgi:SAM-dependent methyltransferase
MTATTRFDAGYYRRFYGARKTRVADLDATRRLAGFVVGYLRYLRVPLRSVLDVGCGLGHWRTALQELAPRARHHGVEVSDYLCKRFGWTRGSVVDHRPGRTFDLVVCQGVLQYLDDGAAARALDNLARLARGALYLEALTRRDWRENCDRRVTDGAVHLRDGAFYRDRLRRHFTAVGGGVFVRTTAGVTTFELETT